MQASSGQSVEVPTLGGLLIARERNTEEQKH